MPRTLSVCCGRLLRSRRKGSCVCASSLLSAVTAVSSSAFAVSSLSAFSVSPAFVSVVFSTVTSGSSCIAGAFTSGALAGVSSAFVSSFSGVTVSLMFSAAFSSTGFSVFTGSCCGVSLSAFAAFLGLLSWSRSIFPIGLYCCRAGCSATVVSVFSSFSLVPVLAAFAALSAVSMSIDGFLALTFCVSFSACERIAASLAYAFLSPSYCSSVSLRLGLSAPSKP